MLGGWGTLTVRIGTIVALAIGLALTACAGRDPQPVATVQPQDATSDCAMITAEISANNTKFAELSNEEGLKVGQNVAAGVAGIVICRCGSRWTSKVPPARKSSPCRRANIIYVSH